MGFLSDRVSVKNLGELLMATFLTVLNLLGRVVVSTRTLYVSLAELLAIAGYDVPMEDGLDAGQDL